MAEIEKRKYHPKEVKPPVEDGSKKRPSGGYVSGTPNSSGGSRQGNIGHEGLSNENKTNR